MKEKILLFFQKADSLTGQHKKLVYSISLVEVLIAVFLLINHYQPQLLQGTLIAEPKTYSVAKFDPKTRYVVRYGDVIRGKEEAGSKIKIIFTNPKIIVKPKVDSRGLWTFTIPADFMAKRYRMAVIVFDKDGKNPEVKYYRLRVESNSKIDEILRKIRSFKLY